MRTFSLVCVTALAVGALVSSGCSVINSFDDLKEASTAGVGGSAGNAGSAGQGGSSGGGSGGTTGGTGGTGGSGGQPVDPGLIVVAGDGDLAAGGRGLVISALSPYTGEEYTRREFGADKIGFIAYDAIDNYWYVWTQEGEPGDLFTFRVWQFDRLTREFKELGTTSAPLPTGVIAVLNKRVLYWSLYKDGASSSSGFTLLNIDNASQPVPTNPIQDVPSFGSPLAAIPRANGTDPGGTVNLFVRTANCSPDVTENGSPVEMCDVDRILASVTSASTKASFAATKTIGRIRQSGGSIGAVRASEEDVVIFPDPAWEASNANTTAQVVRFNPTNYNSVGTIDFDVKGSSIRGAAWDPCGKTVLATETLSDTAIFAVPFTGTTTRQSITTPPVSFVFFDQYTQTAFLPRDSTTNFGLRAFALGGTAMAPTLSERDSSSDLPWSPPSDLQPKQVQVETPPKQFCP
ncbi:MAG: hypothetical protein R3B89_33715 [Polyangiaceae bacterium]